jgi:hypothetical protein
MDQTIRKDVYPSSLFPCPAYAVLGNHDYKTPKEQSILLCWNDSKSEVSGLPAEPHLDTLQCLLLTLVEHRFVVCLSCAEQVVDDSGKLVSCSGK